MDDNSEDDVFPAAYRAAQREQAERLRDQAVKAGLEFEAYLAPHDAEAVLDLVGKGDFMTPAELVWVAVQQFIEMQAYPDLRRELLKRELQKSLDDPRPSIPAEEVFANLEKRMAEWGKEKPARWEKVGQEFLTDDPEPDGEIV